MQYIFVFARNSLNYSKLFPIYIFIIASALSFINKKNEDAIVCILCLPLVNISTSIAVGIAVPAFICLHYFVTKQFLLRASLTTILLLGGIFFFYAILTSQASTHVNVDASGIVRKIVSLPYLKTSFNIMAGSTLQILLVYLPFLILFYLYCRNDVKKLLRSSPLQLFLLLYLSSLLGWAVLHDKTSSTQIFTNVTTVSLNIFACYALIVVWSSSLHLMLTRITVCTLILLYSISLSVHEYRFPYAQSNEYIEKIITQSSELSPLGSFIFDPSDYQNIGFSYIANFAIPGNYLLYSKSNTFPMSLSPHNFVFSTDPFIAKLEDEGIKNTPFWIFVEEQKELGQYKSIAESQVNFIDRFKINYLICTKRVALPEQIRSRISAKLEDPITGEVFYRLTISD